MKVKHAVELMAKNPNVDFPWKGTLVTLLNSLLEEEDQFEDLDPSLEDIEEKISSLSDSIRNVFLESTLPFPEIRVKSESSGKLTQKQHFKVFLAFGLLVCLMAAFLAFRVGDAESVTGVMEVFKLFLQLIVQLSATQ